jgi:uncharacterized protein (DUF1330 family)
MPDTLVPFGGIFLARGRPEAMAGEPPSERIVMLMFPDVQSARQWRDSDEYRALLPIRDGSSTSRVYVVDGENLNRFARLLRAWRMLDGTTSYLVTPEFRPSNERGTLRPFSFVDESW